jgi:hypothetical protein
MKMLVALVALLALVGSAMAWDLSENLQYTLVKNGFEQAGADKVLPQVENTQSGAYFYEPDATYGEAWGVVTNQLGDVVLDRNTLDDACRNPAYSAADNNFYVTLTQGGSASLSMSAKDTITKDSEIVGTAKAYQNLWVGGEFSQLSATFTESKAIIGFQDIDPASYTGPETTNHYVVTDTKNAVATVDGETHAAGYFNTANTGVQVEAGLDQNYVGSGWAEPTYSGGITMWANFAGACDPHCANPIMTSVTGSAGTGLLPANTQEFASGTNNQPGWRIGDTHYWGTNLDTPNLQNA